MRKLKDCFILQFYLFTKYHMLLLCDVEQVMCEMGFWRINFKNILTDTFTCSYIVPHVWQNRYLHLPLGKMGHFWTKCKKLKNYKKNHVWNFVCYIKDTIFRHMFIRNTFLLIGLWLITHDASVFDILTYLENEKQMLQNIFVNKFEQLCHHIMYIRERSNQFDFVAKVPTTFQLWLCFRRNVWE